ncbi:cold-responsive protein kinase 1-like isoform X1 [Zingiber officinale]|uniref:cold-responsive protein kinase 1-like isoform X1 n=1 Tax=Zingiber officinale TaxID=94328 RepID=UPI001C4B20AF|nr:cold-responsive protein kinase 1-like isoform X1 [Zingiber officinale]XP_042457582.1 cold-responsive protein kinase 1-like isoform X1 [Zingiber officinale]
MACFSCILRTKEISRQQHNQFSEDIPGIESVTIYTYKELKNATNCFSPANKIGEGGFGSVYKGRLRDGKYIAVKVLSSESKQGAREFLTEITVISGIIHDNLVKLYGCCVEGSHRILVYNYLENNSLAQCLLGSNRNNIHFNWRTRVKISVGVARGLTFLHEEVQPHVVHRDIKASNILLDKDLTPKISDFGLAKLLPANMTHVSTRVAGTIGYLAPEYAIRGQVTRKSDIYSYGVLLLEIVSGRCNTNTRLPYKDQFLLERSPDITNGLLVLQTWALYESGKLVDIIDTSLTDDLDVDEACRFLKVGLLCTQDDMKLRPSMSTVIRMLTGEKDVNSVEITRPGIIDDLMDLKIKSKNKADPVNASSTSSALDTPSSLDDTTHAFMSFTTISERD